MPKEFGRNQRVGQFIKEELSVLVQREFPLNQYGMITLTNVDVNSDLSTATIYITVLNSESSNDADDSSLSASLQKKEKLVKELNEKKGFFRHEISRMLTSRGVPTLRFKYDESVERAQRLSDIINSVSQSDEHNDEHSHDENDNDSSS
ncbi:MAG TPA: 30S ribosome-binding factor RbfA [Thiotrichaceae bacterium]|jgi:ribosome-binding factor A|nr:30S ribosome-binding factor RbfA [Thiotrichaceae bacterium]HIM08728.1 30S ribosome-binding factor RbfA [Gammaproteobacteria bacterium]